MKAKRETRPRGRSEYHIQWDEPNDNWPKGAWSLYRITGDEIAQRIIFAAYDHDKGYQIGPVQWRHSWCGYLGMFETWEGVLAAIEEDAAALVTSVTYLA